MRSLQPFQGESLTISIGGLRLRQSPDLSHIYLSGATDEAIGERLLRASPQDNEWLPDEDGYVVIDGAIPGNDGSWKPYLLENGSNVRAVNHASSDIEETETLTVDRTGDARSVGHAELREVLGLFAEIVGPAVPSTEGSWSGDRPFLAGSLVWWF